MTQNKMHQSYQGLSEAADVWTGQMEMCNGGVLPALPSITILSASPLPGSGSKVIVL